MDDVRNLPGLKAREISRTVNGKGVGAEGPVFYRVRIETCCLNADAIRRQHGLEMMIGNAAIADAMGLGEDIAKIIDSKTVFFTVEEALTVPLAAALEGK